MPERHIINACLRVKNDQVPVDQQVLLPLWVSETALMDRWINCKESHLFKHFLVRPICSHLELNMDFEGGAHNPAANSVADAETQPDMVAINSS